MPSQAGRNETGDSAHGATINDGAIEINPSIGMAKKVDIAYAYALQARSFSNLFAAKRMTAGSGGKIVEIELRIEGQERIWDLRIQLCDKLGDASHLPIIHIPRHKERAGNEERRKRSPGYQPGKGAEIFKGLLVRHAAEGIVNLFVPGFEVKLDASS
jgi:hypothetical protein